MKRVLGLVMVVLLAAGALAQEVPVPTLQQAGAIERERIRQVRVVEQARFATEEAQCYQRCAVNDCLQEVRRARRDVLADLRRQEMSINDAQRKRRAAEQLIRADEKMSR